MSRGVSDKITYKPYNQGEQWLLPPSLDELVPQNHFVRIVSKTVDELEIEEVFARNTKGGGASRYNPVMLLKVLIYSIIDTKSDVRYEGLEDIEYFDSLDEIPELSQDEYDQLVDAGNAVTIENFPLGNPADPSSTETIIELYDDIEINVIDDSVFKLIMEI